MASWAEFEATEPDFAARSRALLTARKHLTMATIRKDGSPRISGTEITIEGGELRIGSMPSSVKGLDLRRDPRVAIHGPSSDPPARTPARWRGEAKVAGIAREVEPDRFVIDLDEVVITRLDRAGSHLIIESWRPGRGHRLQERE